MTATPTPRLRARPGLTRVGSLAAVAWLAWAASVAAADNGADRSARALKQSIMSFHAAALLLRDIPSVPSPHVEIFFEVPRRNDPVPAHHLPGWLRVALDAFPAVEHTYTDPEWHALAEGALHLVLTAPATRGTHTLAVTFKGIDRNGKPYLRTKTFSFESARPSDHQVLRFRAAPNEEPALTLDTLGDSLFRSPATGTPTDELAYRIGLFEAASGNHDTAASYFLAALDPTVVGLHQTAARLGLAESYAQVGMPEEAESLLEKVAAETPDAAARTRAWFLIERIAAREGRHVRVLDAHDRLGPELSREMAGEAHALAGLSALALRRYAEAEAFFRAVPRSSLDAPLAAFGHAQALAGKGDAFTAATLFAKLGQARSLFDPVSGRVADYAHAALGLQLVEQGRYEEAIAELGRVPADHPRSETSLFAIGWCLRKTGEHVKAIAVFADLLSRAPAGPYAHEARLAIAASYADLRATTRSVAAYRAALDALSASSAELDQLRDTVLNPAWNPLAPGDRLSDDARRLLRDDPAVALATERYQWLLRFERELRRAIERLPGVLSPRQDATTLGGRLQKVDGAHLLSQGQELTHRLEVAKKESREALAALIVQAIAREQDRLEEWSVQASLGIARNLRDDLGEEALSLE